MWFSVCSALDTLIKDVKDPLNPVNKCTNMSKRTLRPKPTNSKVNDTIIIQESEDEYKSECSTVLLKKSEDSDSDVEYMPSDNDEPPEKKRLILSSDDEEPTQINLKTKRSKTETKVNSSNDHYSLSDSDIEESPQKKKRKIVTKSKETKVKPSTSVYSLSDTDEEFPQKRKRKLSTKSKISAQKTLNTEVKPSASVHCLVNSDDEDSLKKENVKLSSKTASKCKTGSDIKFEWFEEDLLAEKEKLKKSIARSMIKLFEEGNTIPFIARYRRHLTGDMAPEEIRNMKESYDEIIELKSKSSLVLNKLTKTGKLTSDLKQTVLQCRNLEELEHIYAPYKQASKASLAERAKSLGLEESAIAILDGNKQVDIDSLVQTSGPEGLRNRMEVEKNIIHILGHIIAHDSDVLTFLRDLTATVYSKIVTKITASAKNNKKDDNVAKFENYFDTSFNVKSISPHQILAINRGENLKILTVKVQFPDFVFSKFKNFCVQKWLNNHTLNYSVRNRLIRQTLEEIYTKKIIPFLSRKTRTELKATAHKSGIEVFAKNVKQLLLEPPVKGKTIMGIDPGFKLGCKIAVISQTGEVLDTSVIYPNTKKKSVEDAEIVKKLLLKHNCTLVAIGNGTACRETESWLTDLSKFDFFKPLDISYTIVDESGASVYSCSDEAKKEFSDLDPLKISAISLARRIQDPLAELVKIDPKSLGVGMYQHDINQKLLDSTLNEVISECVSFVGVDLNTASHCLLRRVAGLTSSRAESIITHRQKNGPFTNRYQLKDVKGIGDKVFEQCSGFLRVIPSNSTEALEFYKRPETTPLDATDIHPETYNIAEKILDKFGLFYKHIGLPEFIKQFTSEIKNISIQAITRDYNSTEQTLKLIIDALSKPLAYDLRSENPQGPIFKKDITTVADLRPGISITGRVQNVVHFGAFVDIGVGSSGLIHKSKYRGQEISLGQRVQVKVLHIENNGAKIGLQLENILN